MIRSETVKRINFIHVWLKFTNETKMTKQIWNNILNQIQKKYPIWCNLKLRNMYNGLPTEKILSKFPLMTSSHDVKFIKWFLEYGSLVTTFVLPVRTILVVVFVNPKFATLQWSLLTIKLDSSTSFNSYKILSK